MSRDSTLSIFLFPSAGNAQGKSNHKSRFTTAVDAASWFGLDTPEKTPRAIVTRLHVEMIRILAQREVRERLEAQHAVVVGNTPDAFRKFVATEIAQ